MRILFLSQVLPYPLDAGPKARSYYVLRHLTQQHEVTLLTFVRDSDRPEDVAHLADFCNAVYTVPVRRSRLRDLGFLAKSLLSNQPFLILRDHVPEMTAQISRLLNESSFDVVHADQLWMAQYALAAKAISPSLRLILDQHNAVYLIPRRLAADTTNPFTRMFLTLEAKALEKYEAKICRQFNFVVWVTAEDRQAVAALSEPPAIDQTSSAIIPICVDPTIVEPVMASHSRRRITFLGGLHWPPNAQGIVWFANEVFPQIRAVLPNTVLTVIGKNPPAGLDGPAVEVTGYVPDLRTYLADTAVFLVPLHAGGGMRVKILDAWSWGLPIVSTAIGAEGIDIQDGENMLRADTPQAFAKAVIRVLEDQSLANQLSHNGRHTVLEKYNWRKIYSAWDDVYQHMVTNPDEYRIQ